MNRIHLYRFALATGTTMALLYTGCVFITTFADREGAIVFFNTIAHGIDFTSIIRTIHISFTEAVTGFFIWFIIGGLSGASMATIYNFTMAKNQTAQPFSKA